MSYYKLRIGGWLTASLPWLILITKTENTCTIAFTFFLFWLNYFILYTFCKQQLQSLTRKSIVNIFTLRQVKDKQLRRDRNKMLRVSVERCPLVQYWRIWDYHTWKSNSFRLLSNMSLKSGDYHIMTHSVTVIVSLSTIPTYNPFGIMIGITVSALLCWMEMEVVLTVIWQFLNHDKNLQFLRFIWMMMTRPDKENVYHNLKKIQFSSTMIMKGIKNDVFSDIFV